MLAKLAVCLLALGLCACSLLAMRQSRLAVTHELARTQLKIGELDGQLWKARAQISLAIVPQRVEEMALAQGPLRPFAPADAFDAGPAPEVPSEQLALAGTRRAPPEARMVGVAHHAQRGPR